jgi:hypothetical protein
LIGLESARCEAISSCDFEALDRLLAEDLTHTHIDGRTQDKQAYLAGLRARPRQTTRGDDLAVRLYSGVAVMTGTLRNTFGASEPGGEPRQMNLQALQVWVDGDDGWRQVAFASSGAS